MTSKHLKGVKFNFSPYLISTNEVRSVLCKFQPWILDVSHIEKNKDELTVNLSRPSLNGGKIHTSQHNLENTDTNTSLLPQWQTSI